MEIQKDSHKLVSASRRGWLQLKEYRFNKRRVYRDRQGEVSQEVPFTEHVFLISCRNQAIWLRPEQLRDLKDLLEDSEEGSPPSQPEGQQRLETFRRFPGSAEESGPIVIEAARGDGNE